jgi:ferredoxin
MGNTPEDLCVKCGLCLPHCPTFTLTQDENRSPRGRITVIQGLTNGGLTPGSHTAAALGSCLSCYRCQAGDLSMDRSSILDPSFSQSIMGIRFISLTTSGSKKWITTTLQIEPRRSSATRSNTKTPNL